MTPNREDIIKLARDAGFDKAYVSEEAALSLLVPIERLFQAAYAAGAAAERERVASWMIQRSYATGHGDTTEDLLKDLEWQVRESEREACAKVADNIAANHALHDSNIGAGAAEDCAELIRARSQP